MHINLVAASLTSIGDAKSKKAYLTFEIDIEIMYSDFLHYQEKAAKNNLTKKDLLQMIEMDLRNTNTKACETPY